MRAQTGTEQTDRPPPRGQRPDETGCHTMTLGIIDYKAGNSQSVAAAAAIIDAPHTMVKTAEDLAKVDAVILPGVGSAGATMDSLKELGLVGPLGDFVMQRNRPYLGICVGLQVIFEASEEDDATCLGWLPGQVKGFDGQQVRVPQIGWNHIEKTRDHPIFDGIADGCYGYFVNSYHAFPDSDGVVVGQVDYGSKSTAIVAQDNIWATQFHIEKSGPIGLRMFTNFAREAAKC